MPNETNMNSAPEDFNLIMRLLKSITPGDMTEEAASQLISIGERIQRGGRMTDEERSAIEQVVGAMPEMQMSYEVDGRMEAMTPSEMQAARDSGEIMPNTGMTDAERVMAEEEAYFKRLREEQEQMYNMSQQAMQQQMQSAAPETSLRPRARPMQ